MQFTRSRLYLKHQLLHRYDNLDCQNNSINSLPFCGFTITQNNLDEVKLKNKIYYHSLSLELLSAQKTLHDATFKGYHTKNKLVATIRKANSFLFLDYCINSILLFNRFKFLTNNLCVVSKKNQNGTLQDYLLAFEFQDLFNFTNILVKSSRK